MEPTKHLTIDLFGSKLGMLAPYSLPHQSGAGRHEIQR
jgi:hypothetical protein